MIEHADKKENAELRAAYRAMLIQAGLTVDAWETLPNRVVPTVEQMPDLDAWREKKHG